MTLRFLERAVGGLTWLRVYEGPRLVGHFVRDLDDVLTYMRANPDGDPDDVPWLCIDDPRPPTNGRSAKKQRR